MKIILKRLMVGLLCILGLIIVAGLGFGGWLVLPGRPSSAKSLDFVGYVSLPKPAGGGPLSVLDYLTVDSGRLFVTSESSGAVYRVPLTDGVLPGSRDIGVSTGTGAAHGVVVDPVSKLGFVSRSDANMVDVFDTESLATLKRIPVDDDVDGIFYDPANKLVYAVSGDPKSASLIDPAKQAKVGVVALGGKPEFAAFDPQTKLIYQNLTDANAVAVVDLAKRAVVDRWSLGDCQGPTSMALDLAHRLMFVVCSANAELVVMTLADHRIVWTTPIGAKPDSVAYDPDLKRVYTTGKPGVMSVIQQDGIDRYHLLDTVKLHYGAHTLAIDPATHRVYVGYASLLIAPRLAVFSPHP